MSQNEVTIQNLIEALDRIRGWAAAVRAALETADPDAVVTGLEATAITNAHLVATQKITETWIAAVRTALESMEGRDTIRIDPCEGPPFPELKPLGKQNLCNIGPIVGNECAIDIRLALPNLDDRP
jgi:hypothetical protein